MSLITKKLINKIFLITQNVSREIGNFSVFVVSTCISLEEKDVIRKY